MSAPTFVPIRQQQQTESSDQASTLRGFVRSNHALPTVTQTYDAARLTALAAAHYKFVWRSLRRFGLTETAADDGAQQVFLVALRRLHEIEVGAEKAFLYRTASLVAMEIRRVCARRRELTLDVSVTTDADDVEAAVERLPARGPTPEDAMTFAEERSLLCEALRSLDQDLRQVLVMFEIDGLATAEIATLLEIPKGTCASRLRRGREQLRDALKRLTSRSRRSVDGEVRDERISRRAERRLSHRARSNDGDADRGRLRRSPMGGTRPHHKGFVGRPRRTSMPWILAAASAAAVWHTIWTTASARAQKASRDVGNVGVEAEA